MGKIVNRKIQMLTYLINPSEKGYLENAGDRMPLGLLSIASNLKGKNEKVKVFDMNHTSEETLFKKFKQDKPDYMGISVYTSASYVNAIKLAKHFKGKTKLIAGGYHASALPESLVSYFDLVVQGEGDQMKKYRDLWDVVNVGIINDLSKLSVIDRSFLSHDYHMNQSGKRAGTIITSRGCPYNCCFCGKISKKVRFEPLDKIKKDLKNLEGYESIYFLDDVFTINKKRMKQIVELTKVPFRITSRANLLDESKIETLAKNGCEWISLGIESGNNQILKNSNKQMTTSDNYNVVKLANKYGIKTKGFFILGLPGETKKTAKQTIKFSKDLKEVGLTSADFYYLSPFPGTPIWNNPEKFGIEIIDRDFTKYLQTGKNARCYINTKKLKAKEIEELVKEAKEW